MSAVFHLSEPACFPCICLKEMEYSLVCASPTVTCQNVCCYEEAVFLCVFVWDPESILCFCWVASALFLQLSVKHCIVCL